MDILSWIRKLFPFSNLPKMVLTLVSRFHAMETIAANCFGAPRTSLANFEDNVSKKREVVENEYSTSGIWTTASYINHSCVGSCHRAFIGDMMIIRATENLPKGTELSFPYVTRKVKASDKEAQEKLKTWGFECNCAICADMKATSDETVALRKELLEKADGMIQRMLDKKSVASKALETILEKLEPTYCTPIRSSSTQAASVTKAVSLTPRPALFSPYFQLAVILLTRGEANEAVIKTAKSLEALGYDIDVPLPVQGRAPNGGKKLLVRSWGMFSEVAPCAFNLLFQAYEGARQTELAVAAKEYLTITYAMVVGESETVFNTFPRIK